MDQSNPKQRDLFYKQQRLLCDKIRYLVSETDKIVNRHQQDTQELLNDPIIDMDIEITPDLFKYANNDGKIKSPVKQKSYKSSNATSAATSKYTTKQKKTSSTMSSSQQQQKDERSITPGKAQATVNRLYAHQKKVDDKIQQERKAQEKRELEQMQQAEINKKKSSRQVQGTTPIYERADAILEKKKKRLEELAQQKENERRAKLRAQGLEDEDEIIEKTKAKGQNKKLNTDQFEQKYQRELMERQRKELDRQQEKAIYETKGCSFQPVIKGKAGKKQSSNSPMYGNDMIYATQVQGSQTARGGNNQQYYGGSQQTYQQNPGSYSARGGYNINTLSVEDRLLEKASMAEAKQNAYQANSQRNTFEPQLNKKSIKMVNQQAKNTSSTSPLRPPPNVKSQQSSNYTTTTVPSSGANRQSSQIANFMGGNISGSTGTNKKQPVASGNKNSSAQPQTQRMTDLMSLLNQFDGKKQRVQQI